MKWMTKYIFRGWGAVLTWGIACGASAELPAWLSTSDIPTLAGFAPIFPDTCYHFTHYWPAAADIPVASDNPAHYADAIRYNAR
ncbi:hypothetical protein LXG17_02945, partial [Klebsiella pneumoniae]|uniref:hypothetical protein n=1 Tax=Klebsiella pneumoniae TaxID=573 RepID=UPI001F1DE44D